MEPVTTGTARPSRKIAVYDFRRPDKFSRDQVRVMAMMHESFARVATTALAAHLRCTVHVHVARVDQLTYVEFIRSIPNPTALAHVDMDPLKGAAILEIDPQITFAILDRLFGGNGPAAPQGREHTAAEIAVLETIVARLLGCLREAWSAVVDLRPRLGGIETNPLFAQIVPPTEMVALVELETKVAASEGMMNLCLPFLTIQDVIPKLSQRFFYSSVRRAGSTSPASVSRLPIALEISYEAQKLSLGALARLGPGALVELAAHAEGSAVLRAGGAAVAGLRAGRRRGSRGAYAVLREGGGLAVLARRKRPAEASGRPDGVELALRSFATEIGGAMKAVEDRIASMARKQEELQDQLVFRSPEKEVPVTEGLAATSAARPFHFLTIAACESFAALMSAELPQLSALVLSHLQPGLAACVLGKLPEPVQIDVAGRIARMGRVLPETLRVVERVLEADVRATFSQEQTAAGGVEAAAEILGVADRELERKVIGALEAEDAALAEQIKQRMLVFEDIVLLGDRDVQKVLREVDAPELAKALKGAGPEVREKIFRNMSADAAGLLREDMERMGPVRLRDVDAAQQLIVGITRKLEEQGAIEIARRPEQELVP